MKLHITEQVQEKIWHWVDKADFEVSGLGIIEIMDGVPVVTECFLLEQEGSAGETELKAESINKAEFEHRNLKKGEIRWWWHSHVNMSVYWSPVDKETIKQLGTNGWFFHTVFNKERKCKSAFSCPQTIDNEFVKEKSVYIVEEIPTIFWTTIDKEKVKAWDASFDEKVKKRERIGIEKPWERNGKGNKKKGKEADQRPFTKTASNHILGRQEAIAEIEDAFEQGSTDAECEFFFEAEIRRHGFNIQALRALYQREKYAEGYGAY